MLSPESLSAIQRGTLATRYKGLAFLKSPFDIALYTQLIDRLRPGCIIEIGAHEGGSALWFADTMGVFAIPPRVVSVDLPDIVAGIAIRDARITFLPGDVLRLGEALPASLLADLPRPWLVVEDSAHLHATCHAALMFFHAYLRSGDMIVIEDGVVKYLPGEVYRPFGDGPTRAVADFLADHPTQYEVDREICDFYGRNVTWSPGSWLRRR